MKLVDINLADSTSCTPVIAAANGNDTGTLLRLIKYGASVNCGTRSAAGGADGGSRGNGKRADPKQECARGNRVEIQRRDTKRELPRGPSSESQDVPG